MPDIWVCYHRRHGKGTVRVVIRGVALKLAKSTARADLLASGGEPRGEWSVAGRNWLLETSTGTYVIEPAEGSISSRGSGATAHPDASRASLE
jgi:hypothetical protein